MSKVIKRDFTGEAAEKILINIYQPIKKEKEDNLDTVVYDQHLIQAEEEAKAIIDKAVQESEAIRNNIKNELDSLEEQKKLWYEQATKEGYHEGFQKGKEKGYLETSEKIQFANQIVQKAKQEYNVYLEKSEQTILSIALKVAEKVVNQTIAENKEAFLPIVKKAIKEAIEYKEIQIFIHPNFYTLLVNQQEELFAPYFQDKQIYIYPDEELTETSCIIESGGGRIDASVDSQFQELKTKLFELILGDHT
ncbi:flagellar assembly protein FliH [Caldibacillus lycopersici]|uniref:Flagellar assembly protein FliH n=1 Tax=Perspicuibacillus lycopersici TaxID=1325689 RepID=A0AAE3IU20_9BACI|nr:flagellar assembly protein FliH [Perspicuibacillus lycopersici]MCU9612105.1 flagellar assembly protein FliH [Perspicuibacillus lycopersici]